VIPEHFPWFGCRFSRASFKLHARTADAIITVSNAVKRDVLAHTGIDPAKLVPIHNGFDPDRFRKIDV
jgi:glycosyltransferase involved in cell wall biosynthesis